MNEIILKALVTIVSHDRGIGYVEQSALTAACGVLQEAVFNTDITLSRTPAGTFQANPSPPFSLAVEKHVENLERAVLAIGEVFALCDLTARNEFGSKAIENLKVAMSAIREFGRSE